LGAPAPVPDIEVYAGDPLDISCTFNNMDRRSFTHVGQIRHRRDDATPVATFTVSTPVLVDSNTVFTLHLDGDSEIGVPDSITRTLGRSAYWDVQEYNTDGTAGDTLLSGRLVITEDVTR
jgi:hypothetical protein